MEDASGLRFGLAFTIAEQRIMQEPAVRCKAHETYCAEDLVLLASRPIYWLFRVIGTIPVYQLHQAGV